MDLFFSPDRHLPWLGHLGLRLPADRRVNVSAMLRLANMVLRANRGLELKTDIYGKLVIPEDAEIVSDWTELYPYKDQVTWWFTWRSLVVMEEQPHGRRSTIVFTMPDDERKKIVISFKPLRTFQETQAVPEVSLAFVKENGAAEWMPHSGPLTRITPASENTHPRDVLSHHLYPTIINEPLNFSQLAVQRYDLNHELLSGNYDYIFAILQEWANG